MKSRNPHSYRCVSISGQRIIAPCTTLKIHYWWLQARFFHVYAWTWAIHRFRELRQYF